MTTPYSVGPTAAQVLPVRTVSEQYVEERNGVVCWWSGLKREGEWIVPRNFRAFACMGNIEVDLTYARMGVGITEMELYCFMGNVEVTVPADIRVVCDGDAMVGSFEIKRVGNPTAPDDAPILKISGTAYVGAITIKVVDPNAPGWAERLKAKWAALKG